MTELVRSRYALTLCAAAAILAGCGGGNGNPLGPNGLPSARAVVPPAMRAAVTSVVVTVLYKGKPTLKGSKAVLFNGKGQEVRRAVAGTNGNLRFPNVPQKLALRLGFQVAWEDCTGKSPNRTCTKHGVILYWPGVDKVAPPPFPTNLVCDYGVIRRELCSKK